MTPFGRDVLTHAAIELRWLRMSPRATSESDQRVHRMTLAAALYRTAPRPRRNRRPRADACVA